MAAALAAAEAVGDAMSPKEKAAEVGLAVAESAAAAGMSLEEQMEAHRCIGGRFWVDVKVTLHCCSVLILSECSWS